MIDKAPALELLIVPAYGTIPEPRRRVLGILRRAFGEPAALHPRMHEV